MTELARALRCSAAQPDCDEGTRRELLDRAFLAFHVELERSGPIDLQIENGGFRADGLPERVSAKRVEDLFEALRTHDVRRVRFTPDLSRDDFRAFVEFLDDHCEAQRADSAARGKSACSGAGLAINEAA